MSRSGLYEDDGDDPLAYGRWRAQVKSAIKGKRGQALLRDMLAALDAMPDKRLIAGKLIFDGTPEFDDPRETEDVIVGGDQLVTGTGRTVCVGDVCALGALGRARGMDMSKMNQFEAEFVADAFGVAHQLAREIIWMNDDAGPHNETPEQIFTRVRAWVAAQIIQSR